MKKRGREKLRFVNGGNKLVESSKRNTIIKCWNAVITSSFSSLNMSPTFRRFINKTDLNAIIAMLLSSKYIGQSPEFSKSQSSYIGGKLKIFTSSKAYIHRPGLECLKVPRTFYRIWHYHGEVENESTHGFSVVTGGLGNFPEYEVISGGGGVVHADFQ